MTTTLANQLRRINLANGGSMSRFFGQPSMRDIRGLLSPSAPKLQLD
jgi:hypothetical protein